MQQAAICKKEIPEELPEYTSELRAKVIDMVDTEFNRQSLRGGWPFPLVPESKNHFFGWITAAIGFAAVLVVIKILL